MAVFSGQDQHFMEAALLQASAAMGHVAPNPAVGCVIVADGHIIGQGFTQPPGGHHAEAAALHDAARHGHPVKGATVYVTLEPCSHFGRTPPCADALVKAGVARVVVAANDPNPLVNGQGIARLRAAAVEVSTGLFAARARDQNPGFFSMIERGRPWVRTKIAASADGRTALENGVSQWITGPEARLDGHRWRARAQAVMTGIGTVLEDDPELTVRDVPVSVQPLRVVVDSYLRCHPGLRLISSAREQTAPVLIATGDTIGMPPASLLRAGIELLSLPDAAGKVDLVALIAELGCRQIQEIHVEAGSRLNAALFAAGCIDECLIYLAPSLLGKARGMLDIGPLEALRDGISLQWHDLAMVGTDVRLRALVS